MKHLDTRIEKMEKDGNAHCLGLQEQAEAWINANAKRDNDPAKNEASAYLRWMYGPFWESGLVRENVYGSQSNFEEACTEMQALGKPLDTDGALLANLRARMPNYLADGFLFVLHYQNAPHATEWLEVRHAETRTDDNSTGIPNARTSE